MRTALWWFVVCDERWTNTTELREQNRNGGEKGCNQSFYTTKLGCGLALKRPAVEDRFFFFFFLFAGGNGRQFNVSFIVRKKYAGQVAVPHRGTKNGNSLSPPATCRACLDSLQHCSLHNRSACPSSGNNWCTDLFNGVLPSAVLTVTDLI